MSLKKQFLTSRPVCKVTFRVSRNEAQAAEKAFVVGDFNHWDELATPMKKLKSGDFTATLSLERGRDYQFRYLLDSGVWQNDPDADHYVPSPVSHEHNSVVRV